MGEGVGADGGSAGSGGDPYSTQADGEPHGDACFWGALPAEVVALVIDRLGMRQSLRQHLLCVSREFRTAASALFFNEAFCRDLVPSLPPSSSGLLNRIREGGWEQLCRKVFRSEQRRRSPWQAGEGTLHQFDKYDPSGRDSEFDDEDEFAHAEADYLLFLVEMRCTRGSKRVVFARSQVGSCWGGQSFGWQGNGSDKASRVVLDKSDGIVFSQEEDGKCHWPTCGGLADAFHCTIRAVAFVGEDGRGAGPSYNLSTLVHEGALTFYDVGKYQCILPGIDHQAAGGADELYLRVELDYYGPHGTDMPGDVRPTKNVCWMQEVNLTLCKGPNARLNMDQVHDQVMETVDNAAEFDWGTLEASASPTDVLSALRTVRFA